jgi:hypothetical protein
MDDKVLDFKEKIITYLTDIIKKDLYDVINFDNELKIDTHIVSILSRIFGGLLDRTIIFLISKDSQDIYEITRTDLEYGNWQNKIKEIQFQNSIKNYKFQIISMNMLMEDGIYMSLFFISPNWVGIIFIPIKRIVKPSEGELFAIDEDSLNKIKVLKVRNHQLNIGPLKFIENKIIITT